MKLGIENKLTKKPSKNLEFCFQKVVAILNETLAEKTGPICWIFCDFSVSVETTFIPSVVET